MPKPSTYGRDIADVEASIASSESDGYKKSDDSLISQKCGRPGEGPAKDTYGTRMLVCKASISTVVVIVDVVLMIAVGYLYARVEELSGEFAAQKSSAVNSAETANQQQNQPQNDTEKFQAFLDALPKDAFRHILNLKHIENEHHGIGSQNIAHIYGSTAELQSCFGGGNCKVVDAVGIEFLKKVNGNSTNKFSRQLLRQRDEREFRSLPYNSICTIGQVLTVTPKNLQARYNHNNDVWCVYGSRSNEDQFMISGRASGRSRGIYRYFKPAPWLSEGNFIVPLNYAIKVLTDGMYMVFATVNFLSTDSSMTVIKEDEAKLETSIGTCMVNVDVRVNDTKVHEDPELTCSVSKIVTLKAHDMLHMRFSTERYFLVREDMLYMTVIKLNSFASHLPTPPA